MWIALKFFVLLQSKQRWIYSSRFSCCCELLSNFLYFCSRNNTEMFERNSKRVVNCSQIFCTFAVETTRSAVLFGLCALWIALKFFVLLQSKQHSFNMFLTLLCCELLSNFLYFCSRNNPPWAQSNLMVVVNCSQIFCTFAVETTYLCLTRVLLMLWIALKFFVLLQSKQLHENHDLGLLVVNCSQIFCTFAVETTRTTPQTTVPSLWIALKFFVLLQSKQPSLIREYN